MTKSRGNGEGTIYQRKDGRWCGQITVGTDYKTGKPKRKTIYGKTRGEVKDKMTEHLYKLSKGTFIEPSNMLLEEWLNKWLAGRKPHLAVKTWESYETNIRCHIIPELGKIKLKDLTTRAIQDMLNQKLVDGKINGDGGLSNRSVRYIYVILHAALKQATNERLIPFNVADPVEPPPKKIKEVQTYSISQVRKLLNEAKRKNERIYTAILLELTTGLRRGEVLGLKWSDIDFNKGILTVRRQMLPTREEGLILKEPKTESSKRKIVLNEDVLAILKGYKAKQNKYRLAFGQAYQDKDLVFCIETGKLWDPISFTRMFKKVIRKAGLPDIRFHDLRHTFATMSLEAGVPAKTIQEILGHSSISTTLDIYSHVTKEMKRDAADKIGKLVVNDNKKISPN